VFAGDDDPTGSPAGPLPEFTLSEQPGSNATAVNNPAANKNFGNTAFI
jgi:hypothetical protein